MLYHAPTGSTDPNAPYVGKNVAAGIQGSKVPPGAVEMDQREIVNTIVEAGLTPTDTDLFQLLRAIRGGQITTFTDTGTVNNLAIAPTTAHTALKKGLPFRIFPKLANTLAAVALTVSGLTAPVVKAGGSAPAPNDIVAGQPIDLVFDGTSFRLMEPTASDIAAIIAANSPVQVKADATFWVRADANGASPDGSANTQAAAFPSIAAARDYVKNKYYFSSFNCIFRFGVGGNYAVPGAITGIPNWQILGDPSNPGTYNVTGANTGALVNCIGCNGQATGFTLTNTGPSGSWASVSNGSLNVSFIVFASSGQTVSGSVMSAGVFGNLTRGPGCVVNGCNAAAVMSADQGRVTVTAILTLQGSSTLSVGYLVLANLSTFITSSTQGEYSAVSGANLGGKQYSIDYFCKANINGNSPNGYFPGGTAGTSNGYIG